jgi:hypothetical protein
MFLFQIIGLVLVLAGIWQALRMWELDRQMQRHRVPDASPAAYLFVPIRWQRRLYTDAGQPLVGEAWRTTLRMYAFTLLGGILLMIGSAGS